MNTRLQGKARCLGEGEMFRWSGRNSEHERRKAATELSAFLDELERRGQPYHIIAHSHGGNVVHLALLQGYKKHLTSCSCVGTPYYIYRQLGMHTFWSMLSYVLLGIGSCLLLQFLGVHAVITGITGAFFFLLTIMQGMPAIELFDVIAEEVFRDVTRELHAYSELPVWCREDEAIGLLTCTVGFHQSIVPRMSFEYRPGIVGLTYPWLQTLLKCAASMLNAVVARIYNHMCWPHLNRFICRALAQRVQGIDCVGLHVRAVRPYLTREEEAWSRELPGEIRSALVSAADRSLCESTLLPKARAALAEIALNGTLPNSNDFDGLLTGRELVHTSYFDNDAVRELLCLNIQGCMEGLSCDDDIPLTTVRRWLKENRPQLFSKMQDDTLTEDSQT